MDDFHYVLACRYSSGKLGYITNLNPILWGWDIGEAKTFIFWEDIVSALEENGPVFEQTIQNTDIESIFIKKIL